MSNRSRLLLLSDVPGLPDGPIRVVDADAQLPHPRVVELVRSTVGQLFGQAGADSIPDLAWSGLPTIRHLSALMTAADCLDDPNIEEVIISSRTVQSTRELIAAPSACARAIRGSLTPRVAMWRAGGEQAVGSRLFDSLALAQQELVRLGEMLAHPQTLARVPDWDVVAAAQVGALGVVVEGLNSWSPGLSSSSLRVEPEGSGYELHLDVPGWARPQVRLGIDGGDLVVAVGDVGRWLPLDPVLRRCRPVEAVEAPDGYRIRFEPDESQWRSPSGGEA